MCKPPPFIFAILCVLVVITSCDSHSNSGYLTEVEQLMDEHPDSAMLMLDAMSYEDLKSKSDRALYGLLYTQCLDKNYLDPTNDSIISLSADYYASTNNHRRLATSVYYLGRTYYHRGDYSSAIVSFFKAKTIAENNNIDFWAGMASRGMADIYNATFNAAEELAYAQEEYKFIEKSGRQPYLNYALLDLGNALGNNKRLDESNSISSQLLDSAKKYDDTLLRYLALQLNGKNLIESDEYSQAYKKYIEICKTGFADSSDSLNLCNAMIEIGKHNDAKLIFDSISGSDNLTNNLLRYKFAIHSGDQRSALNEIRHISQVTDSAFRSAISHNLTSNIADYFESSKTFDDLKSKNEKIKLWTTVITLLIMIAIICYTCFVIFERQKREINEKVILAEQLREELNKSMTDNKRPTEIMRALLSSKYQMLEELCQITLNNDDSKMAKEKIARAVGRFISDISVGGEKNIRIGRPSQQTI